MYTWSTMVDCPLPHYRNNTTACDGVVEFDMFSVKDCERLLKSIESYAAKAPRRPPNSMNNYGTIVPVDALERLTVFVNRHTQSLFAGDGGGALYLNHAFTVRYRSGEDLHLDMHTDDSDITCNVCLGRRFSGGDLAFCGLQNDETNHRRLRHVHRHSIGRAVMHSGRHRHGALPIASGERTNLVMWFKSTRPLTQRRYLRGPADPVCVSHKHDADGDSTNGVQAYAHTTPFSRALLHSQLLRP